MTDEEKELISNKLYQDLHDEKYNDLIDFCVEHVFVKNNVEEYHLMLQYIILINRLDELEKEAKNVPFFISTSTSVKKHPIYELISQSNQNLVKLANALQISRSNKVALEDYKAQQNDNEIVDGALLLMAQLNNTCPYDDETVNWIVEQNQKGEVTRADINNYIKNK